MPGLPAAARAFGGDRQRAVALVEFNGSAAPASFAPNDRLRRLASDCNVDLLSHPTAAAAIRGDAAPALAPSLQAAGRFIEVVSKDNRRPIDVASSIAAAFGEEVATVLPVPFAIPAIAPPGAQSGPPIMQTPDFHNLQTYGGSAPGGLGFADVAGLPGANGAGITFIDLEGGWVLGHEALRQVRYNVWTGSPSVDSGWIEHGTAVSSILMAPLGGTGIAGLVPATRGALASIFAGTPARQLIAQQIDACRGFLQPGDVLLVEVQRPGPATDFEDSDDQKGYLPTSFWPDVKESIRACIAAGITVVEVGGNGGVNLGDPSLQGAFDQTGSSLSALGPGDSGGIMVGAGRPPNGSQPPRARLDFSNYGDRIDCQAWGENVVSAGYGDLWGTMGGKTSYTREFMGTSSAGPLVAATAVAIQGRHKSKFGQPVPPLTLRQILASFGSPQAGGDIGRIGPQPDLVDIFRRMDLL